MRFSLLAGVLLAGVSALPALGQDATPAAVIDSYGDLAEAMYGDALEAARVLDAAVESFVAAPGEETLAAAREAWRAARVPYQQTEGFRFGNAIVDDWEGRVNAWPLDEGLIDYVDAGLYGEESEANPLYTANVVATTSLQVGPDLVDASVIDAALLGETLQEAMGVEANVATGYHAIEFLLWGQDLNGTDAGAGDRPYTDYDPANCTGGNCERRAAYLVAATDLLVGDLEEMAANWAEGGAARAELAGKPEGEALASILTGLGSLSYGELAGERMKLGVLLHDPEEEHDCFSDNTHNSHYYDQAGMVAIWTGRYGDVEGTAIRDLVAQADPAAAERVDAAMAETTARMQALKDRADEGVEAYDQMLAVGNAEGNQVVLDAVDALVLQARAIEGAVTALGLTIAIEGSDSLDNPEMVAP